MTADPGAGGDDLNWMLDRLEEVVADTWSPSGEPVPGHPGRELEPSH